MPDRLHFTGNDAADLLLAQEPMALLIGFALDQQVPVPTAFSGPLKLKQRLGTLDAGRIARTDPATLEAAFREKPAIHRFPGTMATRVQDLSAFVEDRYDGRAERLWTEARDSDDLRRRIEGDVFAENGQAAADVPGDVNRIADQRGAACHRAVTVNRD